ncbi:unnamed protein product [Fraxinus pennsylvanica]|uniref:Uncharacterized protein n=1 Tax=Fraxinus pennsylvanica TaxID=56036 RepID=A0AAD1ZQ06_9LAMI|nr:unnamed protein product [Fraxinus pennsylvanica]
MRGVTDIHEWRDASEGLKESCLGQADMEYEVLPVLLYSYHRLRDPRLKRCFLYCSLYPEDYHFRREELIRNFISEELMERRLSWQAEVAQGHAILNQLVRACLLESDSDTYVKMHDLIRDMAIRITKDNPRDMVKAGLHLEDQDNPRYMVKAGLHLEELPEAQEWTEELDKVSLMDNYIREISPGTSPKCPSLSTLILRGNPLRLIPECFFKHMCGLRTLNLSFTEIESLPNSISDLEKLNALLLRDCSKLVSVPSLEKLKVLRRLELSGAIIEEVPQGMESLTNLKRMSLICHHLKKIPKGNLYRLKQLQQLELPNHLDAPIEDVEALKQLEVIQVRLNSVRDLNRLINSRQIDKQLHFYKIILGSRGSTELMHFSYLSKCLFFEENSFMESSLDTDENMLPRDIENLFFSRSGLSGCLLDEFPSLNYARDLKECRIKDEDKIECIMRSSTGVPFQSLERLQLCDLPNLIGLFKWEAVATLPPGTFSSLKSLSIKRCDKIKKLFPRSLVRNFHNLQSLAVFYCYQMEEIIEDDNNEGADITLPMLEDEQRSSTGVPFQSLVTLELYELPNLVGLFKWKAVAPLPPGAFSSLERLDISHCHKIKKLFPQSLVHNFHNLQSLSVSWCYQMEEIIEDDNNEGADITLPMLKKLELLFLLRLKSICKGKMICDSIDRINLWSTKNLKELPLNLPLLHGQLSPPPCLKSISIKKELWESLEWADHNAKNVLQPLVSFENPFAI